MKLVGAVEKSKGRRRRGEHSCMMTMTVTMARHAGEIKYGVMERG
jgi:hypothetical protein